MQKLKIYLAQLNYHTGNFEWNEQKICQHIQQAKQMGADLVVFSELSVCGYPARDFLEFKDFIQKSTDCIERIAKQCEGIAALVGGPSPNPSVKGKDLYNSAFFLADGKVQKVIHKTLLPNYDIFDEYRYFEPNRVFDCITYKGFKMAVTICEDLWNVTDNPMYIQNPMDELAKQQPDLIINMAASPFSAGQDDKRKEILTANALRYKLPVFYTNHIGAQTHLIFDGGSMVLDASGHIIDQLNMFEEDYGLYETDKTNLSVQWLNNHNHRIVPSQIEAVHDALVLGIREYFRKQGFTKAILGLSGGIDSAVVLALAVQALGNQNVLAVLLPSQFSSAHSVTDSLEMVKRLNVRHEKIPIEQPFSSFEKLLEPQFKETSFSIAEENMQSRIRGLILMALSNKFGYILLNTSNKSELAVGYGTLYGDMCGGLSVIGDLYKTQVYQLANYINSVSNAIPSNIITKEPSAELRPNQKDSDSLPAYDILDRILFEYIELRKSPSDIIQSGMADDIVKRVLKMVNTNEWKRLQAPPVLRVSSKSFGPGRRMPIVAKYLS